MTKKEKQQIHDAVGVLEQLFGERIQCLIRAVKAAEGRKDYVNSTSLMNSRHAYIGYSTLLRRIRDLAQ